MIEHNTMSIIVDKFKKQPRRLIFSSLISLFWVVFLWNFWSRDVYALGINASIFLILVLIFLNATLAEKKLFSKSNLTWLIPLALIVVSFAIYDNPFIKIFNLLTLPVLGTIFINYSYLKNHQEKYWDIGFFLILFSKLFTPFAQLKKSVQEYNRLMKIRNRPMDILKKIIIGLVVFILLAMLIIVPLLSSADPEFAKRLGSAYQWLTSIISVSLLLKIVFVYILSLFLYAIFLAWQKPTEIKDKQVSNQQIDSIISGIVIGGILSLYLLFFWL